MVWSNKQIKQWQLTQRGYKQDTEAVLHDADIDRQRSLVQQEMAQALHSFLEGASTLKAFNTVFQQKTHETWNVFHLRGMSGGLFLNKLVKYVPSEETFAHLLRLVLRVPEDVREGQRQMQAFTRFLEGLIATHQVTRGQLQPARVPFFLSAWWHVQDPEHWPIFYLDVRRALLIENKYILDEWDPIEAYFVLCTRFLSLTKELDCSSWELEHLCTWSVRPTHDAHAEEKEQPSPRTHRKSQHVSLHRQMCVMANRTEGKPENTALKTDETHLSAQAVPLVSCRTHLQWLLAKLGHKIGCRVWIASKDHRKVCQNERLGNLSLAFLPVLADSAFQKIISGIDVLWLRGDEVVAAYEIEQANSDVTPSLLRLYDLGALFPHHEVQLCVVAPRDRFEKVQFELSRPTFHEQDTRKQCALIAEEMLLQQEEHILRWASGLSVIKDLTCQVESRAAC